MIALASVQTFSLTFLSSICLVKYRSKCSPILDRSIEAKSLSWSLCNWPTRDSHKPCHRLPLLSTRHVVSLPVTERHCSSAGIKLYCLVIETYVSMNIKVEWSGVKPFNLSPRLQALTVTAHLRSHCK